MVKCDYAAFILVVMKNLCIYWYFPLIINLHSIKAMSLSHKDRACSFSSAQDLKIKAEIFCLVERNIDVVGGLAWER